MGILIAEDDFTSRTRARGRERLREARAKHGIYLDIFRLTRR
jgi:hypothetical protein